MRKKLLFVYNSFAGKSRIKGVLAEIINIFTKAGYDVTAHPTQCAQDAEKKVRDEHAEYDLVVCSGGDGTLDEVVSGMMSSGFVTPLGYIPAGSTNDFANSLRLPKSMTRAAHSIVEGKRYACDVGSFNRDFFIYIAAFGLFTEISYETKQEVKNVLGHMAYLLEGVKKLSNIRTYNLKIEGDNFATEGEFIYGMITNSTSVGGFQKITGKNVKLNDGLFEVTLIKPPKSPLELQKTLSALLGADMNMEYMYCFKTSHLEITCRDEVAWTLDGEFGGRHKRVVIDNNKRAVELIVPQKKTP